VVYVIKKERKKTQEEKAKKQVPVTVPRTNLCFTKTVSGTGTGTQITHKKITSNKK
jgi:hypothetical protein